MGFKDRGIVNEIATEHLGTEKTQDAL